MHSTHVARIEYIQSEEDTQLDTYLSFMFTYCEYAVANGWHTNYKHVHFTRSVFSVTLCLEKL